MQTPRTRTDSTPSGPRAGGDYERFERITRLGAGALSDVELVRDRFTGARLASKRVAREVEQRHGALAREYRIRSGLRHPQVPRALDLLTEVDADGTESVRLLSEYVEGSGLTEALEELLAEHGPQEASRLTTLLLAQALNVVGYLHERGVAHADLKPENLVVARDARRPLLSLIDFGTSLELDAGNPEWVGGTPAYLAPYVRAGEPPGVRSDLYALGRAFDAAASAAGIALDHGTVDVIRRMTRRDKDLVHARARDALVDLVARAPELAEELARDPLPMPLSAPFVGRKNVLAALEDACRDLEQGLLEHPFIVLRGEQGSGRTRLLEELERSNRCAGVETHRIRCRRPAEVLEPVHEIFARVIPATDPAQARLTRLLVSEGGPEEDGAPPCSSRELRDLARLLREAGARRPLAVLVDDLDLADEATWELLSIFGRIAGGEGPLFVATALPYTRRGPETVLELEPLAAVEVEQLARGLTPTRIASPELPVEVARLAGGSPARAHELTRALLRGLVPGALDLGLVLARTSLRGVDAAERRVLEVLSILERESPERLLAEVLELEGQALDVLLRGLVAAGLVVREETRSGPRFQVASAALRTHLVTGLEHERARELHARALRAWSESLFAVERPVDMLARHALAAGLDARALELGRTAVRRFLARGALRSAEATIRALLPALHRDKELERRSELVHALADVTFRTGRHDEARELALSLLEGPRAEQLAPDARLGFLSLLGAIAESEGDYLRAEELFELALVPARRATDLGERRQLAERLGTVRYRRGDREAARAIWEEGLALGREARVDKSVGDLLNDLGLLDRVEGELEAATARHTEAWELRRRLGDLDGEARSLTNLAITLQASGELRRALDLYAEGLRLKRMLGTTASIALSLRNMGELLAELGEYSEAFGALEESVTLRGAAGERVGQAGSRTVLAAALHAKGDVRGARRELDLARRSLEEGGSGGPAFALLLACEGAVALEEGEVTEATARASAGLEELGALGVPAARSELLRVRGNAYLIAGRHEEALADLARALESAREANEALLIARSGVALSRALLAASLATDEESCRERMRHELDEALAFARRLDTPVLLAEALVAAHDLARVDGDDETATQVLVEAERLSARAGVPLLEVRIARRMGEQALRSGLVHRAIHWWKRAAETLGALLGECDERVAETLLELPEHRAILRLLRGALAEEIPGLATEAAGNSFEYLERLLQHASELVSRPEDPFDPGGLRPELLSRLLEISRAVNGMHRREEIFAYLRDRLAELFGAENARIVLIGRDGALRLMGESDERTHAEISHTVIARVLAEGRPVLIEDAREDLELSRVESVHRLGLASVLCAPLIVEGETIGVIQFDHREKPGPFRNEDLLVLELFSHQAATALKSMLLLERLDESVERLRSSEAEIIAGERARSLGKIATDVAHEFAAKLAEMRVLASLVVAAPGLSEEARRNLEELLGIMNSAGASVERLEEFGGERDDSRTTIEVVRVLRQAIELARRRFLTGSSHTLRLEVDPSCDESVRVEGRENELLEIVVDLVLNAIEAMPSGGCVVVTARARTDTVTVDVVDEGPGVPPSVGARVFEPFYTTKESGQGMGLALAWGLARRLGGTIEVETRATRSRGARFALGLRRVSAPAEVLARRTGGRS